MLTRCLIGGHGITRECLLLARDEANRLVRHGLVTAVDDACLEASEERMLWPGIWRHNIARRGLTSVLRHYLDEAAPDSIHFGHKVVNIAKRAPQGDPHMQQNTTLSQRCLWLVSAHVGEQREVFKSQAFDTVILCLPAPDVAQIVGIDEAFAESPASLGILRDVGYDSRCAVAVWYSREVMQPALEAPNPNPNPNREVMQPALEAAFGERRELWIGEDLPKQHTQYDTLDLLLYQRAEDRDEEPTDALCTVVGHTCRLLQGYHRPGALTAEAAIEMLHGAVSRKVGLPIEVVRSQALGSKVIDWHVSQMMTPLEAVSGVLLEEGAFLSAPQRSPRLFIAGDFLTQSSFVGCVATARGVAQAVATHASAAGA